MGEKWGCPTTVVEESVVEKEGGEEGHTSEVSTGSDVKEREEPPEDNCHVVPIVTPWTMFDTKGTGLKVP